MSILEKYAMNLLREEKPPQWKEIKFSTSIIHEMVFPVNGALDVLKQMGYTEVCSLNYMVGVFASNVSSLFVILSNTVY